MTARDRTRWLRDRAASGHRLDAPSLWLMLDAVAAIGFAGGLAGAIVAVPDGTAAVLPWAVLVALAGGLRGGLVALRRPPPCQQVVARRPGLCVSLCGRPSGTRPRGRRPSRCARYLQPPGN